MRSDRTSQPHPVHRGRRRAAAVLAAAVLAAGLPLTIASPAAAGRADTSVLDWNKHAFDALSNPATATVPGVGHPPNVTVLHIAMVQGAVYDAVNSIAGGYEPYLDGLPAAPLSASLPAAVATAAHDVLTGLEFGPVLPVFTPTIEARLAGLLASSLAAVPDGPDKQAGIAAGGAAAAAMLAARADDGRFVDLPLIPGDDPGEWRPTPPNFVSDPNAWVSRVDPFVIRSSSQFRTKGPLDVTSRAYAREYDEVKRFGAATGSTRNERQEAVARFYNVNSLELPNRTFRAIAAGLGVADQARLFAQLNLAGADAVISCWDEKVFWSFWRPITAIHQGDNDGNRWTRGDPTWLPLDQTPPYSDHTSGYNCITAAMMHTGKAFFGSDRMSFDVVRVAGGSEVRHYQRFTDVVDDTIDARVYQGLHFRTADVQGARLGRDVARYVARTVLQPVR